MAGQELVPVANALQLHDQTAVQLAGWNDSRVNTIKDVLCPGITDPELELFANVCRSTGLDPFKKQIYAVLRPKNQKVAGQWQTVGHSMTIQTGIDGFRIVAERSRKYRGQVGPLWTADGSLWVEAWIWADAPAACKVGVYRADFDGPLWGVATYREYAQTTNDGKPIAMWAKMPAHMLAKCAEALALRKAFPDDLSGVYTSDEMQQADNSQGRAPTMAPPAPPSRPAPRNVTSTTGAKEGEIIDADYRSAEEPAKPTQSVPRANPLAGNRCSVEGCSNVLTAGQLTMSMTKYGRPVCLLHQKDVQPITGGGPGAAREAAPAQTQENRATAEELNPLVASFTDECKRLNVPISSREGLYNVFSQVAQFAQLGCSSRSPECWAEAKKHLAAWWEAEQARMAAAEADNAALTESDDPDDFGPDPFAE